MRVTCRLFARYAEVVGLDSVELELEPGSTVADAVARLRDSVEGGSRLPARPMVAVNHSHSHSGDPLSEGDELALLPPLAGG